MTKMLMTFRKGIENNIKQFKFEQLSNFEGI